MQSFGGAEGTGWDNLLLGRAAAGERVSLAGCDLRGIDLCPMPGPPIRLDGADLRGAKLTAARLPGVSLRGAAMDGAVLVGADLRDADLSWSGLRGANLSGADLRGADLTYADLRQASLLTADLTGATASGADLRESLLHAASLAGAALRGTDLRWSRLSEACLVDADLGGARFEGAILSGADLTGARLAADTVLRFAFLHGCRLQGTALCRHHLEGGIGESYFDPRLAAATYRALGRVLLDGDRRRDADWARGLAARYEAAAHRPDRARKYFPLCAAPEAATDEPKFERTWRPGLLTRSAAYYAEHTVRWWLNLLRAVAFAFAAHCPDRPEGRAAA